MRRSFHVISRVDFSTDINFGQKREYLYFSGEELKELIVMQFFINEQGREFRVLM